MAPSLLLKGVTSKCTKSLYPVNSVVQGIKRIQYFPTKQTQMKAP